jgi:hypothetical protein
MTIKLFMEDEYMKKIVKFIKRNRNKVLGVEAVVLAGLTTVLLIPYYPILATGIWLSTSVFILGFATE